MDIVSQVSNQDSLVKLVQKGNEIGRIFSIDYENALVLTNDMWKRKVNGVPQNSFLIATNINPDNYSKQAPFDKEIILLRVIGSCKLPQDDDNIRTKLDSIQDATSFVDNTQTFDKLTQNMLQFSGLECRVLGTFYMKNQELQLGSDIENFSTSLTQRVYLPKGDALNTIVNYVDPIRKNKSKEDFKNLGITSEVKTFKIGTVRYTSSDRLQRSDAEIKVPVEIQPSDFLSRRTAVLGMTRTGKSNMVKQTVSVVKDISNKSNFPIGQLIFDINGEYANANNQDHGAISDIFKSDCVRYRMIKTEGFESLLINFYEQLEDGFLIISDKINEEKISSAQDIKTFANGMSFEKPETGDLSGSNRYNVKITIYKCLLKVAGFETENTTKISFSANPKIKCIQSFGKNINEYALEQGKAQAEAENELKKIKEPISINDALSWFIKLRENAQKLADSINKENKGSEIKKLWYEVLPSSSKDKLWLDDVDIAMLNMIVKKNSTGTAMFGYKALLSSKDYHTSSRNSDVKEEIYNHLANGKIVILDLSVGKANLREKISQDLAKYIFNKSMDIFTNNLTPPNIMIFIEEAHNLIGKRMELTETWPRVAKEGAKYKIGLVYATQEVSSVHPNILANTENWFVTHLNSENEIRELAKFYDFSDFSKSLIRAQDVGFARVKTLSSSFVVPVQIDKFDPAQWG